MHQAWMKITDARNIFLVISKPLNRSEATDDFAVIQTLLLFICK